MSTELEQRLEQAADSLPMPPETVTARARRSALAALSSPAAARSGGRRRTPLGLVAAGAVVTAAIVLALAAPWEGSSPLATERALAAIGDRPVIHAIVESMRPHATVVDLSTGDETAQLMRNEYWFDEERRLLRSTITIAGERVSELVASTRGGLSEIGIMPGRPTVQLDPALAGFATRYREALETGEARVVGETRVENRQAVLLHLTLRPRPTGDDRPLPYAEVAVDAQSYEPLRFRYHAGDGRSHWWRVVSIETLPREEQQFEPPARAAPRPGGQTGTDEQILTPAQAATSLDRPAIWPGRSVSGVDLDRIELVKLTTNWTNSTETKSRALVLRYGADRFTAPDETWLMVTQTTSRAENPRFDLGGSDAPPGKLKLVGAGDLDGSPVDIWFGSMVVDGVYVALESPHRDLIVSAARAMRLIE